MKLYFIMNSKFCICKHKGYLLMAIKDYGVKIWRKYKSTNLWNLRLDVAKLVSNSNGSIKARFGSSRGGAGMLERPSFDENHFDPATQVQEVIGFHLLPTASTLFSPVSIDGGNPLLRNKAGSFTQDLKTIPQPQSHSPSLAWSQNIEDEDSDFEDDGSDNYGKVIIDNFKLLNHAYILQDWVSVLEDDEDSDGSLGDWEKLETMRLSHPMDFAKQLVDFVSDVPISYMDQPPSRISIHGLLRPAFVEENSKEELQKDESFGNGTSYYKSQPDAVAHSADKIISRVKSGGDKMTRALKSLCWRCKSIQVEEVDLIGVDSLGFYL
ncbi:hypothetical protein L2E82_11049 [Cichorium intybus]|uniref:Uncharacterized protein n=1 Tax=Cichorium intybus TaxID=13427 RepID=A0ACB9GC96_CICIN|nr:hypothetical protein L2E82_11049 [Cichorium intybus]